MITMKDYVTQIQTNLQDHDLQEDVLCVPYLHPFPTEKQAGGFARQNAYFFFGKDSDRSLKTIRTHILKQAVLSKLRVLIQDSGYTAYEDMNLLLEKNGINSQSLRLDIILNRRTEAAEALKKLNETDVSWLKCAPLDCANRVFGQNYLEGEPSYDVLIVSVPFQTLLTKPEFAQELATSSNSAVIVFVETEKDEINPTHPLRPLQEQGNLEDFGAEFNFLSDTEATEEIAGGGEIEMELVQIVSYAKVYSYFPVSKEYNSHDGILEWYVREIE